MVWAKILVIAFLLSNSISIIMAEKLHKQWTSKLSLGISELLETKEDYNENT